MFPTAPTIRGLGARRTVGERKYAMNLYLAQRGDANIRTIDDLIAKSRFFTDVRAELRLLGQEGGPRGGRTTDLTFDIANRLQNRFALQQITLQCMAMLDLDAVDVPDEQHPGCEARRARPSRP